MTTQLAQLEIPHKEWLYHRAGELGITKHALEMQIHRGRHPKPEIRAVNKRVMFVALGKRW